MSLEKNTTVLRNLTILAHQEPQKAIVYINMMLSSTDSMRTDQQISAYLQFLKGLAQSPNQENYLKRANPNHIELMRSLLINRLSDEVDKQMQYLTQLALAKKSSAKIMILQSMTIFADKKEDFYYQYLLFLLQLLAAESRAKVIKKANQKIIQYFFKLSQTTIKENL
ncbi:MAG: hypothetical protein MJB14_15605 [Spirochaetes bacterium]|nr:hypothetical protein [Spirochaetota bacterium]